jgi:hypothetical protein
MIPSVRRGVVLVFASILLAACASGPAPLAAFPTMTAASTAASQDTAPPPLPATSTEPPTIPTTFEELGSKLYIASGSVRIGVETEWGGAISEIWFKEQNLINNYDGGRLMAVSFYDSDLPPASSHPNDTGWNATPSDMYNSANSLLEYVFSDNELYTRSRYIQWFPDDKGGGGGRPVPTDIIVESRIAFYDTPETIRVIYRVVNEGDASHAIANQEFPFAYVRSPYNRYVTYAGTNPWTNGGPTIATMPPSGTGGETSIATERWAGFVNPDGEGLVLWAPQSYGQFSYGHFDNPGPLENSTLYLLPRALFDLPSRSSKETVVFMLLGDWVRSRARIQQLAARLTFEDIMPPFGTVDSPSQGDTISGIVTLDGWVIDDAGVASVELRIDGNIQGLASYGRPRDDVARDYPGLPGSPHFGFSLKFDSRTLASGEHTLEVVAEDTSGNASQLRPGPVTINVEN